MGLIRIQRETTLVLTRGLSEIWFIPDLAWDPSITSLCAILAVVVFLQACMSAWRSDPSSLKTWWASHEPRTWVVILRRPR